MSNLKIREMDSSSAEARIKDYSLNGSCAKSAQVLGLANADWYTTPIPRDTMRSILSRKDWPAIRDCLIYFFLIGASGYWTYALWGSWAAIIPMLIYGVLYASASDARWHESSHGTAFKTDWMNNALYEIASFMVLRESVPWRWSHTRHHSDTIIVGRDPEIAVPRPPDLASMLLKCVNFQAFRRYFKNIILHSLARVNEEEATFIPKAEYPKIFLRARIYAGIFIGAVAICLYYQTWLPFVFIFGPNLYGAWLMPIYAWTQHAGLAENVLDHRLNCRTVKMNFIHRFLYWNMNYHLEHHMFPLAPYHQLPQLHELIKHDTPEPYPSLAAAYREIIPTIFRQIRDPGYYIKRKLPLGADCVKARPGLSGFTSQGREVGDGWIEVCDAGSIAKGDVIRFDYGSRTYAIYRTEDDGYFASDGYCTHGNTHLSEGLIVGKRIECPKHNGRFNLSDGSPARAPACVALRAYETKLDQGRILINPSKVLGKGNRQNTLRYKVISNDNVATYIKELVLEPTKGAELKDYVPGQYIQLNIPAYGRIEFTEFDIAERFAYDWKAHHVFDCYAENSQEIRRNYSVANNPQSDKGRLHFNVRIAVPPYGQDCPAGSGSSYVFNLKPGDEVCAIGPFGDFVIKDTEREMVYVGGGAGMAPMRAHIAYLFDISKTGRKVSFWYGARSKKEIFYEDYFRRLESEFSNFSFHIALSEPQPEDDWEGYEGFIHSVLKKERLDGHANVSAIEFYLCGPPMMIEATQDMLQADFGVIDEDIAFDAF